MASQRSAARSAPISAPRSAPGSASRARSRQQLLRAEQEQPLATLEIVERATAGVRALRSQDALRVWKALGSYIGAQLARRRAVKVDGFGIFALNTALEPIFLHSAGFLQANRVRESRARSGGVLQVIGGSSKPTASINMGDVGRDFLPGYSKDVVSTVVSYVVAFAGKLTKQGRVLRLSFQPMGEWFCDGEVVGFQFLTEFRAQTKLLGRASGMAKVEREQLESADKVSAGNATGSSTRAPEPTRSLSGEALVAHARAATAIDGVMRAPAKSAATVSQRARDGHRLPASAGASREASQAPGDSPSDRPRSTHTNLAASIASSKVTLSRAVHAHALMSTKASSSIGAAASGCEPTSRREDTVQHRQAWDAVSSNQRPEEDAAILARVRFKLIERCGQNGLNALTRVLQSMDSSGDGMLSPKELKFGLRDLGVELSASELARLLAVLDRNRDGCVDVSEFVGTLRGSQLNGVRLALVHSAFALMDPHGRGSVSMDDIYENYDVSLFPAVRAKKTSKQQALAEFLRQWEEKDGCSNGACIPLDAFIEHYENVSACIADDSDFALLMRQTWHVSQPNGNDDGAEALSSERDTRVPPALSSSTLGERQRETSSPTSRTVTLDREERRAADSTQPPPTAVVTQVETDTERDWRFLRALLIPSAGVHPHSKTPTVDDVSRKLGANRIWGNGNEVLHTSVFARALVALDRQLSVKEALLLAQRVASSVTGSRSERGDDSIALVGLHLWLLRSQTDAAGSLSESSAIRTNQPSNAVERVRHRLLQRIAKQGEGDSDAALSSGIDIAHVGLNGLQRCLKLIDTNGDKRVSKDELKVGLRKFGVDITFHELDHLFTHFDADRSGCISTDEFLVGMRGEMSAHRLAFVLQAFERLDRDSDGAVTLQELAAAYNTSKHPDVMSGRLSAEAAVRLFAAQWESAGETDGVITRLEFEDYYRNLSASIDSDDYFELMMRNAWHIAGGKGVCANSTNRCVLVTNADGSERICEIRDDLGVRASDHDKVRERLTTQGIAIGGADKSTIGIYGGSTHESSGASKREVALPTAPQSRRSLEPSWQKSPQSSRTEAKLLNANTTPSRTFNRRRVLESAGAESVSTGKSPAAMWMMSNQYESHGNSATGTAQRRDVERSARQRAAQLIQSHFRGFKARKFVQCVRRKLAAEKQRREKLQGEQVAGRKKVLRAALKAHHGF